MKHKICRRSFVTNMTIITLSQLLFGCSYDQEKLQILLLENSIPLQLISDFRKQIDQNKKISFQPNSNLSAILDLLKNEQNSPKSNKNMGLLSRIFNKPPQNIHLATLGDYWLQRAIQKKLIKPLTIKQLNNWQKLPTVWQQLVMRNNQGEIAENGSIFGAPYRWGSTIIAYRSDKFKQLKWIPRDWEDLWNSELQGRISLLNSPREVIGLTLKKLGYSYNTQNLQEISNLETELQRLQKQVKFYDSQNYLQPLILGHTWLAVGWSTDILPIVERYPNIKFIIPQSGTSLWGDVWVLPQSVANNQEEMNLITSWIDFCWEYRPAEQISVFTDSVSPILFDLDKENLPKNLQNNLFLKERTSLAQKSEFLLPLEQNSDRQYRNLWLKVRQS